LSLFSENRNSPFLELKLAEKMRMSVLLKIEIQFLLNNFSLIWPINTKLAVWVAHIKTQLGIATHMSLIKVKVSVTKNRNSVVSATYICVMSGTNLIIN